MSGVLQRQDTGSHWMMLVMMLWFVHCVHGYATSWLQVPTGTSWSMLHEVRIPFGKSVLTLSFPVKYKFDNTSTMTLQSTERSLRSEQEDIFGVIENTLQTFGLDGKTCLLRAICEINESPLRDITLIGEVFTLILTPRRTIQERSFLIEYLKAEDIGRQKGNCWKNYYLCPFSLRQFLSRMHYISQ